MNALLFELKSAMLAYCSCGFNKVKVVLPILFCAIFLNACGGGSGAESLPVASGAQSVESISSSRITDSADPSVSSEASISLPEPVVNAKSEAQGLTLGYDNSKTKWPQVNIYLFDGNDIKPESAGSFPGTTMTKPADANGIWTYVVDAKYLRNGAIKVVFNNASGMQTADLSISQSANYVNGSWVPVASSTEESWVFRGSPNGWGKTLMSKSGNLFVTCQKFVESESAFKISNANKSDWEEAYPAQNYSVTQNFSYDITFDSTTHAITATKRASDCGVVVASSSSVVSISSVKSSSSVKTSSSVVSSKSSSSVLSSVKSSVSSIAVSSKNSSRAASSAKASSISSVKSNSSSSVKSSASSVKISSSSVVSSSVKSSASSVVSSSVKNSSSSVSSSSIASSSVISSSSSSKSASSIAASSASSDPFASARTLYAAQCVACHGVNGTGGFGGVLNTLHTSGKYTLATLATKISTTMPFGNVGLCSGTTPGTCGYDIANMIMSNKWLPDAQSSSSSSAPASSKSSSSAIVVVPSSSSIKSSSSSSVVSSSVKSSSSSSTPVVVSSSSITVSSAAQNSSNAAASSVATLSTVEIAPGAVDVAVGASQQLVAVGKMSDGSLSNLFGKVSWTMASGNTVASISSTGLLKRLTAGTAVVQAVSQGKTATLTIGSTATTGLVIGYDNNTTQWSTVNIYLWTSNGAITKAFPGDAMTAGANGVWTFALDASKLVGGSVNVIFTNKPSGTAQTADLTVGQSAVYKDGTWTPTTSATTSAQVAVIDGTIVGGGTTFPAGTVLTINANTSTTAFSSWTGASAAYIFTDPFQAQAKLVVPSGIDSMSLQALFATAADPFKSARTTYAAQCVACHGVNGAGGPGGALDVLKSSSSTKYTLTTLINKISTSMPINNPGSCTGNTAGTCAYDIANMILSNQWVAASCTGTNCVTTNSLDRRNLRLLTTEEYINSARDIFGVPLADSIILSAAGDGTARNFNTSSSLALDDNRTIGYDMAATEIAKQVIAAKSFFSLVSGCAASDATCVVKGLGNKIFRRPLSTVVDSSGTSEVTRYSALYTTADAGKAVLEAMLISPNFMYRSEMGTVDTATGLYRLNNYEIATLLSYSFWASTPDDTLLAAAKTAEDNKTTFDIKAQTNRLLADARAERGLRRFAQGWLLNGRYGYLVNTNLAAAFDEESVRFAMETIKADLPYTTLLTANYTYANPDLAQYYKSSAVSTGWAKSTFTSNDPRGGTGILGQGSFLATRVSTIDNPSPIKRGNYVRSVLMCQDLPPPQKAGLSLPKGPDDTNRTATMKHTSDPACQGCHQYIDGIGFGLERYGSNGLFRTTETLLSGMTATIDASGSIKSLNSAEAKLDPNSAAIAYQTVPQLATLIANSGQGSACYSRQFYRYITGRNEDAADENIIPVYSANMRAGGGMKQMLVDLATNPSFILRRK